MQRFPMTPTLWMFIAGLDRQSGLPDCACWIARSGRRQRRLQIIVPHCAACGNSHPIATGVAARHIIQADNTTQSVVTA
jgi:hypothetical protein